MNFMFAPDKLKICGGGHRFLTTARGTTLYT
jgi:hypothetical protein